MNINELFDLNSKTVRGKKWKNSIADFILRPEHRLPKTENVFKSMAEEAGFKFDLKKYEPDGKAEFEFCNQCDDF